MIVTVADRDYEVEVVARERIPAPVAIVIPQHQTVELTQLAVDAIRAFTPASLAHVWVVDNASVMDGACEALGVSLILNRTPCWPWWKHGAQAGSLANAVALEIAVQVLGMHHAPSWLFAMHNDSLPLKKNWLEWLCARDENVVGTKASQRSGLPHSQGVLFGYEWLRNLGPGVLLPHLPDYDVAEGPALKGTHWSAWGLTHDPARCDEWCPVTGWLRDERAEVSWDDAGDEFFAHAGGGTIDHRNMRPWIATARRNLGL